jgi:catechol 2,3-dioxygenase-like lactoylglutathione lyase family enzyme
MVDVRFKFDHCVISVSEWARSNRFYQDVLGAELVDRGTGTWAYRFGEEQLNVHGPGVEANPVAREPCSSGNSDLCSSGRDGSTARSSIWLVTASRWKKGR